MPTPAKDETLMDETYLPQEDTAEIIDFLSALRVRGREAADPRPRLTGPDGRSVELPAPHRSARPASARPVVPCRPPLHEHALESSNHLIPVGI